MGHVTIKSMDVKKTKGTVSTIKGRMTKQRRDRRGAGAWKCPPMRSGTIISKIKRPKLIK